MNRALTDSTADDALGFYRAIYGIVRLWAGGFEAISFINEPDPCAHFLAVSTSS